MAFPTIGREELWQKIQDGDDFVLVDALSPITFAMAHLPGAINMTQQLLEDRARRRIPDHDTEVVVYCADEECDSSTTVANRRSPARCATLTCSTSVALPQGVVTVLM